MGFGTPTKLHYAKQLAAALGFVGLIRADRVKIETLGLRQPARRPALRGRRSTWRMLEWLAQIELGEAVPLTTGVRNFCWRNPGKGIVVLITDLMHKEGYQPALRSLLAQSMDVYVVHVLCAEELDPKIQGDLQLIDCEDQDVAEITVSGPLLKRYQEALAALIQDARDFCAVRGATYLLAHNQIPIQDLVSRYLRQRGLVR